MDSDRFDRLTRTLTKARSRRGALASVLGGTLGLLGLTETAGRKGRGKKKSKYTTVTRTVRQSVTQTFANTATIAIPVVGIANPYPSAIAVSGFTNGAITDVNLTLHGFSKDIYPRDVDVLLAATHLPGQNAVVISDAGSGATVNVTLTLDDQAAAPIADTGPLVTGTFQPTNYNGTSDPFPGAAPTGNSALSAYNGGNPNGTWQLFVVDDEGGDSGGQFAGGWSLQITALADVLVQERVPVKKKKRKK